MVQLAHQEPIVVEGGLQPALAHLLLVDHGVEGFGNVADVARHGVGDPHPRPRGGRAGAGRSFDPTQPAHAAVQVDRTQVDEAEQPQRGERRQQSRMKRSRAARAGPSSKLAMT